MSSETPTSGASAAVTPGRAPHGQRTPMTVDTIFEMRAPADPQISPDGEHVAFVLMEWVADQPKQRGRLWMVDTHGGEPRPLTKATQEDASPCWSPDGRWIAFASKRDASDQDKMQIYVLPREGGEARRICVMPNGVSDLAWSPDGSRIAFLSLEGEERKGEPRMLEPGRHQRLWTVRPDSDTPTPVTPAGLTVWSYAWSPDGKRLAVYYSVGPDESDWYRGQIGVVAAEGSAIRQITQLTRQAAALAWSRDGQRIAYISGEWSDRPLVGGDIFMIPVEGGVPRNLTPGVEFSPSWCQWLPGDQRLLYAGWDGLTHQLGMLDETSGSRALLSGDFIIGDRGWPHLSATPDLRRFVTTHSDQQHPDDIWMGEVSDNAHITWKPLTRLNPILEETIALAPSERITYLGADGWRIDALYTPPLKARNEPGLPPLVVSVHGGPSTAWRDAWGDNWTQLLASEGYAVLRPNIRGSLGRGVAFADAVLGDMGGKDFEDVLRGVDHLVEKGLVDGERVGIIGWSYGGFMVAWAVSQTPRFKAAVMGAGICDFHSFHAQSNIPDWDMRFLAAHPLEHPGVYRERSAVTYAARITTPVLIVHGENDECVPVNQTYEFYRALRERGVAVEAAIYPREGHGFRERDHVRDFHERMLRWFRRHL